MISWLVFWGIVGAYVFIGIKRIPTYYRRVDENLKNEFPYGYSERGGMPKSAAWGAIGLAFVWIWYEGGRWLQNYVIHTATSEERKLREYAKAAQIVADYKDQQEREAREAFDRKMQEN